MFNKYVLNRWSQPIKILVFIYWYLEKQNSGVEKELKSDLVHFLKSQWGI